VSELIERGIFEGFWMRFEAQKVIFTSILDAGDQRIMAKIRVYAKFPITLPPKKKAKMRFFFNDFSTFLEAPRYCLRCQNSLNGAYLKGFG